MVFRSISSVLYTEVSAGFVVTRGVRWHWVMLNWNWGRGRSKWRGRVWVFPRQCSHTAAQSSGPAGSRCGGLRDCIGTDGVRKLGLINLNNFYFLHVKFPLIRSHYEIYIATQDVLRDSLVAAVCSEVDFPWRSAKLGSRCFTHSLQFKMGS